MEANRPEQLREAEQLRDAGDAAGSRRLCEALLASRPDDAAAANLMAALAADDGDHVGARRWVERSLAADARAAAPHYTLGRICQGEGRLAEAEASYLKSLELAPDSAKAHNNLGCVQHMQGKLDLAVASYRRALALDATLPQANQNLAAIVDDPAMAGQAIDGYLRHLERNPGDAAARQNLGNVYRELGRQREALACFEEALALAPDFAEARFSLAQALLAGGDYARGWELYEARWQLKALGLPMPDFPQPLWDGAPLPGRTLLIHAEQGIGDTLQFIRYAPLAARRCGAVVLLCQPQLAPLMRGIEGLSRVVARGEPLPPFDAHIPVMSLPRVFRTTLADIPWSGPYVRADADRVRAWRGRLDAGARRRIGLAWAGRPQYWDDRKRSMPLAAFAPLAGIPGLALYSLQWGEAAAQVARQPMLRLRDFGDEIGPFEEMAALVGALDLVISVDTAMTHLAGAMGVPAWLLAAHAPEWRWLLDREDSPWYPSVRIFRQDRPGGWAGAIDRVAAALA